VLARALLVLVACALGAWAGTHLRFPDSGAAVVFLPYAVLTCALVAAPPRHWWIYGVAAVAGDFWPHRNTGAPVSFVLLAEVANLVRAVVAASAVRRLPVLAGSLGTFRGMVVVLLFAGLLAPLAGAFTGGAVVALHRGPEAYWIAWRSWLLSNALTGVTLLPLILIAATAPLRRSILQGRRLGETAVLFLLLIAIGAPVFLWPGLASTGGPPLLYAPLPILLWAAVRLGPGGTGVALVTVAAMATWGTFHGRGPFVNGTAAADLVHLQLFLIVVTVPLLLLSAVLEERDQTLRALQASQQHYRSVVEDQTEMVCRFDPQGGLTFVNGAFCRATGQSADQLLGRAFLDGLPAEVQDQQRARLAALTAAGPQHGWEQHLARGHKAGWEQWQARALFDAQGALLGYQAVGRDISESKRAEEQAGLLANQRVLAETLRTADRRKDDFLAMLSHELRNPLAPLAMALDILRQLPDTGEQVRWAGRMMTRQVAHLTRLVDDLLDVARITRGTLQLQPQRLDLVEVLGRAVEASRPVLDAAGVRLTTHLPEGPLWCEGDPVRLVQLVTNLLHNASKFTAPGGEVSLTVGTEGGLVILRVSDTGVGIQADMLERVFEPFTQVDRVRDGGRGGLGLGLALVRRLAQLHGGTVEASSDGPGQGSQFTVRLPAAADGEPPPPPGPTVSIGEGTAEAGAARPASAIRDRRRILVVDDVVDVAESLAVVLALDGHEVQTAHDGRAALDSALSFGPAVVFLDLQLPGLDGLEVARQLRSHFAPASMLLVATTGFGQPGDLHRSAEAGFDHHLIKPIDPEQVRRLAQRGPGPGE
jgi:PAS domain S-box-containing protein